MLDENNIQADLKHNLPTESSPPPNLEACDILATTDDTLSESNHEYSSSPTSQDDAESQVSVEKATENAVEAKIRSVDENSDTPAVLSCSGNKTSPIIKKCSICDHIAAKGDYVKCQIMIGESILIAATSRHMLFLS